MSEFVKLARDSIKFYLENDTYLNEYDDKFKSNNNGVLVNISQDGKTETFGSIYPTRKDIGLDIIHEAVNAAIFNNAIDLTTKTIDDISITIDEITKVVSIQYIEDFGMYHGLMLRYKNENVIVFRSDYESDFQMFEDALDKANVDSYDIFSLEKFKMVKHI